MHVRKAQSDHDAMSARRYEAALGGRPERLASGSDDFTMFLWEPSSSDKPLARMTGHLQLINQARAGRGRCPPRVVQLWHRQRRGSAAYRDALSSFQAAPAAVHLARGAGCMSMSPGCPPRVLALSRSIAVSSETFPFREVCAAPTYAALRAGQALHARRLHMQV